MVPLCASVCQYEFTKRKERERKKERRRNGEGEGRSMPFPTTFSLPQDNSLVVQIRLSALQRVEVRVRVREERVSRGPASPATLSFRFIVIGYVTLLCIPRADLNYRY